MNLIKIKDEIDNNYTYNTCNKIVNEFLNNRIKNNILEEKMDGKINYANFFAIEYSDVFEYDRDTKQDVLYAYNCIKKHNININTEHYTNKLKNELKLKTLNFEIESSTSTNEYCSFTVRYQHDF